MMGPWMTHMAGMPLDGWSWLWMAVGWLTPIAIVGLLVYAFLARDRARDAEDVLAERYARGEIDEPEFRTRKAVLRGR